MVEFVDDDEIIVILVRDMFREIFGLEALDGNEKLVDGFRLVLTSDEETAEGRISHDAAEGRKALLQQLFSVRDEKKSGLSLMAELLAETTIVESSNDGFPRPCCCDKEILVAMMDFPFRCELIEDGLLVRVRLDFHDVRIRAEVIESRIILVTLPVNGFLQFLAVAFLIRFKLTGIPVAFKRRFHLRHRRRLVLRGDLHIPLQAARNGRAGKIRRADIRCRETALAVEHVGLRMETRPRCIIGNFDFRIAELGKLLDRLHIRRAHVGRRDDAKMTPLSELLQRFENKTNPAPFHKGNKKIDPVSGLNFLRELHKHRRFMIRTRKERTLRQRRARTRETPMLLERERGILRIHDRQELIHPALLRERK